jgi:hypothetical protein
MSLNVQRVNLFVPLIHHQGDFPLTGNRLRATRCDQTSIECSFVHLLSTSI